MLHTCMSCAPVHVAPVGLRKKLQSPRRGQFFYSIGTFRLSFPRFLRKDFGRLDRRSTDRQDHRWPCWKQRNGAGDAHQSGCSFLLRSSAPYMHSSDRSSLENTFNTVVMQELEDCGHEHHTQQEAQLDAGSTELYIETKQSAKYECNQMRRVLDFDLRGQFI
jgi:hypothetical protein